jgi:hypothetical protein
MFHHHLVTPMNKGKSDEGAPSILPPPASFTSEGRFKNPPFHRKLPFTFTAVIFLNNQMTEREGVND